MLQEDKNEIAPQKTISLPPRQQMFLMPMNEISCNAGMELIFKGGKLPSCVESSTKEKLLERKSKKLGHLLNLSNSSSLNSFVNLMEQIFVVNLEF